MQIGADLIIGLLLKYGPILTEEIVDLVHKPDPTQDDWRAMFAKLKTYEQLREEAFAAAGKTPTPLPPA